MKKLTVLLITILLILLIYNLFCNHKPNYVSISDVSINNNLINLNKLGKYNSFYSPTIIDAYQDIKNNKTIKVDGEIFYLKKVLRESDMVVISLGMRELSSNNFDKMYEDIVFLINELKKYAFGKIIFLGYYNPTNYYDSNTDKIFYDINSKLNRLMMDNNITYIPLYELIKGNNYKEKYSFILNSEGINKINSILTMHFK